MRIERVEAIHLRYDYPDSARFAYAGGFLTTRVTTLIRVHTDTGLTGIGSAYSYPSLIELIVRQQLDPLLRGEDPLDVESWWERMESLMGWYGRKGVAITALGGVDTALWDLRGKALGKPVWQLLGGQRDTCPAYASGLLWSDDVAKLAEEGKGHIDDGFKRMKMRLGQSETYDTEAVSAVRAAIGPDHDLMVDASMRYDVELARRIGKHLEDNRVFWYEEPFRPDDVDSYTALRGTVGVPIAAGENECNVTGFRDLIRAGALDIVQPDASRCGGITAVRRVAELAEAARLHVATHTWSDAVAVVANAHAVSAAPNGLTVEVDRTGTPFIEELLTQPLCIENGELKLGNGPGLGIEVNEDVISRYRMDDPLTMPPGAYSDMLFGKEYMRAPPPYERTGRQHQRAP